MASANKSDSFVPSSPPYVVCDLSSDAPPSYSESLSSTGGRQLEPTLVSMDNPMQSTQQVVKKIRTTGKFPLHNASKGDRTLFLRKVYGVLLTQGLMQSVLIAMFLHCPLMHYKFEELSNWTFWPCWIVTAALALSLTSSERILRSPAFNLVIVAILTTLGGVLLGSLSVYLQTEKILIEVGIVTGTFLAILVFLLQKEYYFTPVVSTLHVWISLAISFGVLNIWYEPLESVWILVVPFAVLNYMVVTTVIVMKDENLKVRGDECIYGAISISFLFSLKEIIPCVSPIISRLAT